MPVTAKGSRAVARLRNLRAGPKSSWALRLPPDGDPPPSASWADGLPIVRDQYDDKSCGCWAGAYSAMTAMWIFHAHGLLPTAPADAAERARVARLVKGTEYPDAPAFSPSWIFDRLRRSGNWTSGADSILVLLRDIGTVQWWDHPCSVGGTLRKPRRGLERRAEHNRISAFGFFERPHDDRWQRAVRWWLAHRSPVLVELLVTEPFLRRPLKCAPEEFVTGAPVDHHVVACVGYDADRFLIANSWGTAWGQRGLVWIPGGILARMSGPGHLTWGMLPPWHRDPAPSRSDVWTARMTP